MWQSFSHVCRNSAKYSAWVVLSMPVCLLELTHLACYWACTLLQVLHLAWALNARGSEPPRTHPSDPRSASWESEKRAPGLVFSKPSLSNHLDQWVSIVAARSSHLKSLNVKELCLDVTLRLRFNRLGPGASTGGLLKHHRWFWCAVRPDSLGLRPRSQSDFTVIETDSLR